MGGPPPLAEARQDGLDGLLDVPSGLESTPDEDFIQLCPGKRPRVQQSVVDSLCACYPSDGWGWHIRRIQRGDHIVQPQTEDGQVLP